MKALNPPVVFKNVRTDIDQDAVNIAEKFGEHNEFIDYRMLGARAEWLDRKSNASGQTWG